MTTASGDWVHVYRMLFDHPKTKRLARRLGLDVAAAAGYLICMWSWAMAIAPDGDLSRFDEEEIEVAAGWGGDDGRFVAAATECRWLDAAEIGLMIHDWDEWAGPLVAKRAKERKRSAERRAAARQESAHGDQTATRPQRDRRSAEGGPAGDRWQSGESGESEERGVQSTPLVDSASESTAEDEPLVGEVVTKDDDATDSFSEFWSAYPNRQGRQPALRTWRHMKPHERSDATEVAASMSYCVECGYRDRDKCPHASTFLHQRRWEEWRNEDGELRAPPGYGPPQNGNGEAARIDAIAARWAAKHEGVDP